MKRRAILSALTLTTLLGATTTVYAQRRTPGATPSARADSARPQRYRLDGALSTRDRTDEEGRHTRARSITLHRGDHVVFNLSSSDFDTVARVTGPGGAGSWQDDDGAGEGTNSRLRFVAPRDGAYSFIATSYAEGETGSFHAVIEIQPGSVNDADEDGEDGELEDGEDDGRMERDDRRNDRRNDRRDDRRDDADEESDQDGEADEADDDDRAEAAPEADAARPSANAAGGRTFGIFVGITNYQGENSDLPGSAADAVQLARAFQRAGWMQRSNAVVLTDREATVANVRQAFRTVAPRVGPNDTLVFFYDGHGGSSELDLRGPDLSRSELGRLMSGVRGRQLLVLDSCSAGGFERIVRGHSNRAGLFSSSASETSSTAPAVGAGGWLAYAFREAVNGAVQRRPDGSLDFNQVVSYVRRQYRAHNVDQTLVAVNSRGPSFAIGGRGDAVGPNLPADTAVASNDPPQPAENNGQLPAMVPIFPQFLNGMRLPTARPGAGDDGLFGSNDQFASLLGTGIQVAGAVLNAATK